MMLLFDNGEWAFFYSFDEAFAFMKQNRNWWNRSFTTL